MMSVSDFESLTPEDFESAVRHNHRLYEQKWEIARAHACWTLQPYTTKNNPLKPTDLCVFPWEGRSPAKEVENKKTREELMAEFERVKRERGLK